MSNANVAKLLVLTVEELKKNLHYNPNTGVFTWVKINSNRIKIDSAPGYVQNGYLRIAVGGKQYQAHRLAWLYMTGQMPAEFIDHINGDRTDNRFLNLRECTSQQNNENLIKPQKNNTTGFVIR